jgi:hypothetical protein
MKCEKCQILIEDFLDGALDQKAGALVTSHMAGCAQCTKFREELSREQEIYSRYQRDVEVTPVLWSSIEARIKQQRAAQPAGILARLRERLAGVFEAPRLSPAFAAALVMIAIGITVAVMTYFNSRGRDEMRAGGNSNIAVETTPGNDNGSSAPKPVAPDSPNGPEIVSNAVRTDQMPAPKSSGGPVAQRRHTSTAQLTPAQLVREAEQKYLAAIAILSRDVNRQRSQLDPIMLARFDASLADIDRAIKETRHVVRENPGDPIALQYLLAAYSRKVDVLREMTNDQN